MGYKRKQKQFVCNICGKDFDKVSQYKRHLKDKHGKDVTYPISVNIDSLKPNYK